MIKIRLSKYFCIKIMMVFTMKLLSTFENFGYVLTALPAPYYFLLLGTHLSALNMVHSYFLTKQWYTLVDIHVDIVSYA